jgi:hypothetical protein
MRRLVLLVIVVAAVVAHADAQQRPRANSKRATRVDSISAPPRMDGNTGKYDTVIHPRRRNKSRQGAEYHYKRHQDTIHATPRIKP